MPDDRGLDPRRSVKARDRRIWELRVRRGMTLKQVQAALAEEGWGTVPISTISDGWRRTERRALEKLDDEIRTRRMLQFHALRNLYAQAMQAWYRSLDGARMVRQRTVETAPAGTGAAGAAPARTEMTQEVRAPCGDPRFLDCALWALASMRDLFALKLVRVPGMEPDLPPEVAAEILAVMSRGCWRDHDRAG